MTDNVNLFTVQSIPGKGEGLVASTPIARGTRILADAPLFTLPRGTNNIPLLEQHIRDEVQKLSPEDQRAFLSLHNCRREDTNISPLLGICKTNALPLGVNATKGGLFLTASRINHSCLQNAQNTWNARLGKITIHAVVDIAAGEEITISYLRDEYPTYAVRQRNMLSSFNFTCNCSLCILPQAERSASDQRLTELARLDATIGDGMSIILTPLSCLHSVERLLQLLEEEGIHDARVPRAYYDAFQIAIANGDQARARVFAQRARDSRKVMEGEDSEDVARVAGLAERPSEHRLFGTGNRWRTNVNRIPENLNEEDFEKWLWRHGRV